MKIIFATHNPYKVQEVKKLLKAPFEITSLAELNDHEDIPEPYETLQENALHKARVVYERYQQIVIAEDTGLEVMDLNNAPGVYTARYAGEEATSDQNMSKLLRNLKDKNNRNAQFRTVAALFINGESLIFEGILKGDIPQKAQGTQGFGYDPIFVPSGHQRTLAEMTAVEKNNISHRSIAFGKLSKYLSEKYI